MLHPARNSGGSLSGRPWLRPLRYGLIGLAGAAAAAVLVVVATGHSDFIQNI